MTCTGDDEIDMPGQVHLGNGPDEPTKFGVAPAGEPSTSAVTNHQQFAHKEARLIVMRNRMIRKGNSTGWISSKNSNGLSESIDSRPDRGGRRGWVELLGKPTAGVSASRTEALNRRVGGGPIESRKPHRRRRDQPVNNSKLPRQLASDHHRDLIKRRFRPSRFNPGRPSFRGLE